MRLNEGVKVFPLIWLVCGKCGSALRQESHTGYAHPHYGCEDDGVQLTLHFNKEGFLKLEEVGRS